MKAEDISLEKALELLSYPRELVSEMCCHNFGRFVDGVNLLMLLLLPGRITASWVIIGFNAHVLCHRGSTLKKAHQSPLGLENLGSMFDTVQSLHLCHRQASDLKEQTNLMMDMVSFYVCGVFALNVRWKQILTFVDTYCSGGYVFHSHVTNLTFVCCGFPWYM